jgi:type I restriction enzyme, S subunit
MTPIGDVFDVYVGATPSRAQPEYWGGGIPWVSSGEVAFCRIRQTRETISQAGLDNSSVRMHPPGTVMLGMIGEGKTRGQAAILDIPAGHNQNSASIRVSEAGHSPEYLYWFLVSEYERTRNIGGGNNQPALNKARVQAIRFPLAPIDEQNRIAQQIEVRMSVSNTLKGQLSTTVARAARLRQAILKKAFEGKLVPQDLNDEPASILLDRIRAERANGLRHDNAVPHNPPRKRRTR